MSFKDLKAEYENHGWRTIGGMTYLTACSLHHSTPEVDVVAIAKIAHEQGCSIWHAMSIHRGTTDRCPCAPCSAARRAA